MERDLFNIGIIGSGPAGCCCAYFGVNNSNYVTLIDYEAPLKTILPTGGGRCNLTHSEFDFKELVKNYPRGEKFLYSVFSKFAVSETLGMFDELGIETYSQDDGRIFPVSNSSTEVREKFLKKLKEFDNIKFLKEKAIRIEKKENKFKVVTDKNTYNFDKLVIATGGHNGFDIVERLGISVVEPKPSLAGLVTKEDLSSFMGITLSKVLNKDIGIVDDMLFTHFGVTGPLIYKISSIFARRNMPYTLCFDLIPELEELQTVLNNNPHKFIKNILSDYLPLKFAEKMLSDLGINPDEKAHRINGKIRDSILCKLHNYEINVLKTRKDGETVTAGGVDLDTINPKTMESKEIKGLYFCGEVLDIDGFCGGFNLQNCWSTGYIAGQSLNQ